MKKVFYLFLALLLPGLIFVFLKYEGRNEFAIPVYYLEGIGQLSTGCAPSSEKPYVLPDSLWQLTGVKQSRANVLIFEEPPGTVKEWRMAIDEEFGKEIVWLGDASLTIPDSAARDKWKKCIFSLNNPWHAVLFDDKGQIRGYYDPDSREESDRLRVELKILLMKY